MKNGFYYETNIGKILIVENGEAITNLYFGEDYEDDISIIETPLLKEAGVQLNEYIEGKRKNFDLPLNPKGTQFQQKVWEALQDIPYGQTCSYKEIATCIGNTKASRAVGMANNKNNIPIFIPCHRVIGTNGKMVGYSAGVELKEKLLEIERENEKSVELCKKVIISYKCSDKL